MDPIFGDVPESNRYQLERVKGNAPQLLANINYDMDQTRIEPMLFDGVSAPREGTLSPSSELGLGLVLRAADARRYRV